MPLYISLERKRTNIYYNRLFTAINLFSMLFGFLSPRNAEVSPFEIDPFTGERERIPLALSLETIKHRFDKVQNKQEFGIEISSTLNFKEGYVPIVFTLLPYDQNSHYDILLEIVPNARIRKFMDIEAYIPNFRNNLVENIIKYNKIFDDSKNNDGLIRINKSFISIEDSVLHNMDNYQLFYSKEPNDLVNELFSFTSEEAKERLTLANRDKLATTLIENTYAFGAMNKLATDNNIRGIGMEFCKCGCQIYAQRGHGRMSQSIDKSWYHRERRASGDIIVHRTCDAHRCNDPKPR